jgi:MoaA/NifB/PqqE/SkfB family radical SAM enzyme
MPLQRAVAFARTVREVHQGGAPLPRMLTYTVTFTCNARCMMCDSWKKPGKDDLRIDEIERIFAQLPRLDAVRLTGGEPFVRRDLADIAHLAVKHLDPAILHVTTNGFLTDRIVDFCERRPRRVPLNLLVSIDGVEEAHDEIRGHRGAFREAMRTLEALAPRRKELRLNLAVNQTIVDAAGARDYRKLREHLSQLDIHNQVVIAYKESATYSVAKDVELAPPYPGAFEPFGEITREQLTALFDELEVDLASYPRAERAAKRYYLDGIRNRLISHLAQPNPVCVALRAHLRIFPNGDVPVCQFNSKRVGSLREQSFDEVWFGSPARDARAWVRACPGCWAECEVLPSAVYSGDLLGHAITPRSRT